MNRRKAGQIIFLSGLFRFFWVLGLWRFGVVGGGTRRASGRVCPGCGEGSAKLPGSRHSRPDARRWHCWEWDARRWHRCFLREIDVSGGAECGKGNYVTGSASRRRRICRLSMRIWRRRGSVLRSCGWIRFLCRSRYVWWRGGGRRTRSGRMRLCCRL